ncbi:MAG: sigma 54-interacting transcriptional regulator [Tepidanaerobacteraceae bacterium]|jgi:transcriptional regulator with AAA-type ATPase domain/transcriptional regulatory protein LevR|nr:sigma 54-interacting transcriptional regulator [Tepidanaerobacteraceae bacterium]
MKDRLLQLIKSEDKKNPYTDDQLAGILGTRRDEVTILRGELGLPDSRERKKPYLVNALKELISQNPRISDRELTRMLNRQGFNVSRFIVSQLRKEIAGNMPAKNVSGSKPADVNHAGDEKSVGSGKTNNSVATKAFERIIGFDGSLKPQIQQAKAAILYPPHGLHTLILGPTGVGKSNLAEAMYNFAVESGRLAKNAPFVIFNCADYAENPQLLLSQLFGHAKGAYTGADTAKEGLVEKADGGILFLDEVHRLPPEGQELLYYLMDKGKFRRLGETETVRTANVMIIAATTEDIESSLLLTFRRRIPMIIELPPLSTRPLLERYNIIKEFFGKEADRIGASIKVTQEALRALLLYDCPGNIGQLRSDIQVACARGFLTYVGGQQQRIEIDLIDLPIHARRGLLKIQNRSPETEIYLKGDFVVSPGQTKTKIAPKEDLYILPQEIYQYIEEKYQELQEQGLSQEVINRVIGGELEIRFQQLVKQFETNRQLLGKQELIGIVSEKVVNMAEKMVNIAEKKLGKMDSHLFYCLAIHLSATLERLQHNKPIINPQLEKVKNEYRLEYRVAKEMVEAVEKIADYKMPEDEVGFVAMYLRTITHPVDVKKGRVGVVVLTHGHVAQGMAEVANRLLGVNHAVGIEMSLDEKPESALQKAMEVVRKIDEGKGVLLLVDMGSLITFGEIITQKTGIQTKTIGRVDTIMVLEAVRRAILPDTDLDEIVANIDKDKVGLGRFIPVEDSEGEEQGEYKKAIVTLCITGEGTAIKLKRLIEKMIPDISESAEIIPIGIIGGEDVSKKIEKIKSERCLAAIVGTVNPKENDIPFISVEELISGTAVNKIRNILELKNTRIIKFQNQITVKPFIDVLFEDLIVVYPDFITKNDIIDNLSELLIRKNYINDKYILDIYKREVMGPTIIKDHIAIPHGNPENVAKPAIAIAVLKKPVIWSADKEVDIVFMLALKEDAKGILNILFNAINNEDFISKLKLLKDSREIRKAFLEYILSQN